VPPDAPLPFQKDWQKLVLGSDRKINRRLCEVATMAHLRNKLRSGDVWVERSSAYRRFDSYLLPASAAAPIIAELELPASADDWLAQRGRELDWRLKRFSKRLMKNQLEGVSFDGAFVLKAFGRGQKFRIDARSSERLANLPHRFADGIQECTVGILHQMPSISDLHCIGQSLCRRQPVSAAAVASND
jgi:hypothetical protein